MTYATLMVHLEAGRSNAGLLQVAADLAGRFRASVIGTAACQPIPAIYDQSCTISADVVEQARAEIAKEISDAEAEFRAALRTRAGNIEWRSAVAFSSSSRFVAREARRADLVITGARRREAFDDSRYMDIGDLVMQLGRPALVVPAAMDKLRSDRMLIAWKDARETRRAAADALPLLKRAAHVVVVEIAPEDELPAVRTRLTDVVGWLRQHGIEAESAALPAEGNDADRLREVAQQQGADIIVAGAYGHNRLREWVLGGVTRDLLLRAELCSLVSH